MSLSLKNILTSLIFCLCLQTGFVQAQEVLLDQMVSAGKLKLFPVYGQPKHFYYLADKIEIPTGPTGKKQFSFLKFVQNGDGSGEGGVQDAQGGGLVHFLINFAVSDQLVQQAEAELQSTVPGAKIIGPITYREGTFALVSNFQQEDGDWTQRVLGLGKAPVMEGHKAAVSIRLTKTGAILLWESFKQAASDISVTFDMIVGGYRNPYEAEMTAWWDRVAKNRSINVGARTDFLGVDIQSIMKELRDEGAIELEVKGEDAKMDRLWEMAYGKLAEQMFESNNDPTTLATLQDDPDVFSNFERANQFNKQVRERIQNENQAELQREADEYARLLAYAEQWSLLGDIAGDQNNQNMAGQADGENSPSSANGQQQAANSGGNSAFNQGRPSTPPPRVRPANLQTPPSFSLLASYRKKQFKKSGKFQLNFKKWTADTQAMRFDENIGGFGKKMFNDPAHFREVNLDDPVYKQREILVQLDGQNSADFDKFVNFVTIAIRKKHQDGFEHYKELKIDRQNFNKTANNFSMLYGYHGDKDRKQWLNYEYKITWNLFGGAEWTGGWQQGNDFMVPVVPPHQYRELTIEADPDVFSTEQVRLATVTFKSILFGKQDSRQVTLKPGGNGLLSKTIRYAHEPNEYGYQYDITWLKRGGVELKKDDAAGTAQFIFADELPE